MNIRHVGANIVATLGNMTDGMRAIAGIFYIF